MNPRFPHASPSFLALNPHIAGGLPHPEPKRDPAPALERVEPRKEESVARVALSFTGYRVHPLDPDNFAGSVKDLIDGLRAAGIIAGDEHWRISLATEQVKVGSYKEERTEIQIYT